ncbi:MAG TPA: Xaa-Pro peptidase family protein [Hyphomicrobiales bacterium]|nr:Xaa-Pro peptidase family protein [Hyphomicrobiales bacterium]
MFRNPFSDTEIARRLETLRAAVDQRHLAAAVISAPENIFYLIGLDHWGYFAPHLLVVPVDGVPVLVTRSMERGTIEVQVRAALFRGHTDSETVSEMALQVLKELRLEGAPLGLEYWTSGLSYGLGTALSSQLDTSWHDITGVVDAMRLVKSDEEIALMRITAAISDAAAEAAIAVVEDGSPESEVAATCMAAMIRAGGHPPGFGPFIRARGRFGEEHATWGDGRHKKGEAVFLELSGCVSRYHAPLGRLVHVGVAPEEDLAMAEVVQAAFEAVVAALKPGARACEVYAAWQGVVDSAGLSHYRRHHCGYAVGIGVHPSWTGGSSVTGLRQDSDLEIKPGMTFHVLSWLIGTGRGDGFFSNTVLVGPDGAEVLTSTSGRGDPDRRGVIYGGAAQGKNR